MSLKLTSPGCFIVLVAAALVYAAPPAEESSRPAKPDAAHEASQVIDGFLESLAVKQDLTDEQRETVARVVEELRGDEYSRDLALTVGLRELYPQFAEALVALSNEDVKAAVAGLEPLSKASDPYLAAESAYYLARAHMLNQQYEQSLAQLEKVLGEYEGHTLQATQALFLQGIAQLRTLQRDKARQSLEAFLERGAGASERMRIGAWRMLHLLEQIEEGSLSDVQQHMDFSRRRLELEYSDKQTRKAQEKIVAMLNKLIEEAEKQEQQGQGQGQGQSQGQNQGKGQSQGQGQGNGQGQGQGGSNANDQSPSKVVRRLQGGPKTPWDHLRNVEREARAFAALKEKFPARYQQLVEQYFRDLQRAGEEAE